MFWLAPMDTPNIVGVNPETGEEEDRKPQKMNALQLWLSRSQQILMRGSSDFLPRLLR